MTKQEFIDKIFDYETAEDWHYKGERPCVIYFYADWNAQCRIMKPTIDKLATAYDGTVDFHTVDTEAETELAAMFGIRSLPCILFIPKNGCGRPLMANGPIAKEQMAEIIESELLHTKEG